MLEVARNPLISEDASRRLHEFVATATNIFMAKGYRRSKMSDVTQAMGLSEGAIYRYFEGKEALFNTVISCAADPGCCVHPHGLPVRNPQPGAILEFLTGCIAERARFESLERALARRQRPADPRAEFEEIVRDIYETTERFRTGLRLVERCSTDWPELAQLWFGGARADLMERLAAYMQDRAERGCLRSTPDAHATAHLILDMIAAFARLRHHDPFFEPLPDKLAEDTVVDNLVNAYAVAAV